MRLFRSFMAVTAVVVGGISVAGAAQRGARVDLLAPRIFEGGTGAKPCSIRTLVGGERGSMNLDLSHPQLREVLHFAIGAADLAQLDGNGNYSSSYDGEREEYTLSIRTSPDETTIWGVTLEIHPIFGLGKTYSCVFVTAEDIQRGGGTPVGQEQQ